MCYEKIDACKSGYSLFDGVYCVAECPKDTTPVEQNGYKLCRTTTPTQKPQDPQEKPTEPSVPPESTVINGPPEPPITTEPITPPAPIEPITPPVPTEPITPPVPTEPITPPVPNDVIKPTYEYVLQDKLVNSFDDIKCPNTITDGPLSGRCLYKNRTDALNFCNNSDTCVGYLDVTTFGGKFYMPIKDAKNKEQIHWKGLPYYKKSESSNKSNNCVQGILDGKLECLSIIDKKMTSPECHGKKDHSADCYTCPKNTVPSELTGLCYSKKCPKGTIDTNDPKWCKLKNPKDKCPTGLIWEKSQLKCRKPFVKAGKNPSTCRKGSTLETDQCWSRELCPKTLENNASCWSECPTNYRNLGRLCVKKNTLKPSN